MSSPRILVNISQKEKPRRSIAPSPGTLATYVGRARVLCWYIGKANPNMVKYMCSVTPQSLSMQGSTQRLVAITWHLCALLVHPTW